MSRHKDVIFVLLNTVALAGVCSKPTFAKLVHFYFATIYVYKKWNLTQISVYEKISRIRGRIIAKNFSDCRNFGMLNYRTIVCRTRSVTHDVHSIIGSSNHFLINSVFSLASEFTELLSFACVKHACGYGGYLEIAEESFLRQIRNISKTQVEQGWISLLCV